MVSGSVRVSDTTCDHWPGVVGSHEPGAVTGWLGAAPVVDRGGVLADEAAAALAPAAMAGPAVDVVPAPGGVVARLGVFGPPVAPAAVAVPPVAGPDAVGAAAGAVLTGWSGMADGATPAGALARGGRGRCPVPVAEAWWLLVDPVADACAGAVSPSV